MIVTRISLNNYSNYKTSKNKYSSTGLKNAEELPKNLCNYNGYKTIARSPMVNFKGLQPAQYLEKISRIKTQVHINRLTSDPFAGRLPGTSGINNARSYIVEKFKEYRLKPIKEIPALSDLMDKTSIRANDYSQPAVFINSYHQAENLTGKSDPLLKDFSKVMTDEAISVETTPLVIHNVMGCIKSAVPSDKYLFITAHYDHLGVKAYPAEIYRGADDNASGVAALLETGRILGQSNYKPDKNIIFVATSGHEMGLLGASYLAKRLKLNGIAPEKISVLNMDSLAAQGDKATIEGAGIKQNEILLNTILNAAKKTGIDCSTIEKHNRTDALAFQSNGFPAVTLHWDWRNCPPKDSIEYEKFNRKHLHKTSDTAEGVNYDGLMKSIKLALQTVIDLTS